MPSEVDVGCAPIVESDDFIRDALQAASGPALLAAVVHLTGDAALLDGPVVPKPAGVADVQGGLTDREQQFVRERALRALVRFRDEGCVPPPPLPDAVVRRLLSFVVGQPVPDEYEALAREELCLEGSDLRRPPWSAAQYRASPGFRVLIVGAGFAGLLAAFRLKQAGIDVLVVEKNPHVGGTWYENRYPGCRVDVANHFYSYSFHPKHDWSEFFAGRDELFGYLDGFAERHALKPHVRLRSEVLSAEYDAARALWSVEIRDPSGAVYRETANAVVSAVGQLNRPLIPAIEGRETFRGKAFHTAAWPTEDVIAGRRVAVVGTGASAFQAIPEIAKSASRLYVFQRSAPWLMPSPAYYSTVSRSAQWLLSHVPYYSRWYRFLLFYPASDLGFPYLTIDPAWPHPERSVNALADERRGALVKYLRAQVGDDDELFAKVLPDYPVMAKRILLDSGAYIAALKRPNVDLVTEPVRRIDPTGIVGSDGHYDVDVIVYGTGFQANRFLWPMRIAGRDGITLEDAWASEPRAYLGITVPGFPNLFCMYGPGTNLVHGGSIVLNAECQANYIVDAIHRVLAGGHSSIECRPEPFARYARDFDARNRMMAWSYQGTNSWYKNSSGKVLTCSPWRVVDYWRWTRHVDPADYVFG